MSLRCHGEGIDQVVWWYCLECGEYRPDYETGISWTACNVCCETYVSKDVLELCIEHDVDPYDLEACADLAQFLWVDYCDTADRGLPCLDQNVAYITVSEWIRTYHQHVWTTHGLIDVTNTTTTRS